jgi:hypothetical protein
MNSLPSIARSHRGLVAAGCAAAALALSPAVASADSIVYVKGGNVWLAAGDGGSQYQVTTDGTAEHPYRSPSQADDGTIAVGYGDEILRMRQNGQVLNRLDPPTLMNSVSHPMDGVPVDVAISPDGTKVAYSFYGYECPVGASCGARTTTGIIPSDRFASTPEYGKSYFHSPSWVTNARILNSGGYGSHVNIQDLGTEPYNWLTDQETDLGDAELTRAGDKLVAVRGYGDSTHIVWYSVTGNALSGPKPPDPTATCATGEQAGFDQPTWAPDGNQVAWSEPDGIWIHRDAAGCDTQQPKLVLPGGSEADWGPANVNPGPRPTTGGGGTTGGGTPGGGATSGGAAGGGPTPLAFTLKAPAGKLRVSGRVVKVKIGCAARCSYDAKLTLKGRMLARKKGTAMAGATVAIKLSAKQARAVRKLGRGSKALKLVVVAKSGGAAGTRSLVVAPR